MAGEFREKGVNIALGPVVGPLGRIATSGRNWEGKLPRISPLTVIILLTNHLR